MPIELKTKIVRAKNCASAPVDNEIVLLNLLHNHYIALDEIGRRVWDMLETPQSVEELSEKLCQEFENTPEGIARDLLPFLNELEMEGIVCLFDEKTT